MILIYFWIAIIIFSGWAIARFAYNAILKSEKELSPEHIHVNVCPICGSLETTTTAENTTLGLNYKCKKCLYVGTMLEMNLVQAKKYEEMRIKKEK
ncbi:hypothetical protein JXA48_02620 [Candidatus Woesearchaeota archaeon]|nr:hypothetical protein [Candidatus Woesearchaeota archaeon]